LEDKSFRLRVSPTPKRFYSANEDDESDPRKILSKQLTFTKFIYTKDYSSLQFNSENFTTLFWDSPSYRGDQLLPGVLTESIASSLVQLCLNGDVMNLHKKDEINLGLMKISFPNFPRLPALKLEFFAARSLSVPKLLDFGLIHEISKRKHIYLSIIMTMFNGCLPFVQTSNGTPHNA
jgi:hypothetical protein